MVINSSLKVALGYRLHKKKPCWLAIQASIRAGSTSITIALFLGSSFSSSFSLSNRLM